MADPNVETDHIRVGDVRTITGTVRTVSSIVPHGHLRVTLDFDESAEPDFRPAIVRGLEARFKAVLAACELAEAEARHVVDDEVYVSVGLVRNALRTTADLSSRPGSPTEEGSRG